jgi:hypothetical protein
VLTAVKSWLTFQLVKIASQLDGELFTRLCEVAVIAHHREAIENIKEVMEDVMRLEQEHAHDHDYYNEREDYDTDSNTTYNINATSKPNRKLH